MDLHRQMQPPRLPQQVAEHKILEYGLLCRGGFSPGVVVVVNGGGHALRRIVKVQRTEVGNLKLDRDSAMSAILLQYPAHERQIFGEGPGQCTQSCLPEFALQQLLLQGNVDTQVYVARGQILVVQREEKRVDKEDPVEAFGIEVISHGDAVGHHRLHVQLVEDAIEVLVAGIGLAQLCFFGDQPLQMVRAVVRCRDSRRRALEASTSSGLSL